MKKFTDPLKNQEGFTLVEVLISILILSIIISSASVAFVYAVNVSRDNKYNMTSMNLADQTMEYIRSLQFVDVGTVGGDPSGVIQPVKTENVDGTNYKITTAINWEEEGDWDALGSAEWDYKNVKITVVPLGMESDESLIQVLDTYVTRDSAQPPVTGGNIRIRIKRGWNTVPGTVTPVANVKIQLTSGPSAPRQVLTTSKGAARFFDLLPGTYTENIDPTALGMILLPGITDWNRNAANYTTLTEEYEAEYPCSLKITLKDHTDNPISLASGINGKLLLQVPYGSSINKTFTASQVDSQGKLPADFITGLWPVGVGYAGAYNLSNVLIPGYIYLGSYNEGSTVLWDGTFTGPGTCKNVTCRLLGFPTVPAGIVTSWVTSSNNIVTTYSSYYALDDDSNIVSGKFSTSHLTDQITMSDTKTIHFNASAIYFENTGSSSTPGLYINNKDNLYLHAGTVVFCGGVEIKNSSNPASIGKIILRTTYQNSVLAPSFDGSAIGGTPGVKYGKVYFAGPVVIGGSTKVEPGGYYFYNGLVLPDNAADLIRFTDTNYLE